MDEGDDEHNDNDPGEAELEQYEGDDSMDLRLDKLDEKLETTTNKFHARQDQSDASVRALKGEVQHMRSDLAGMKDMIFKMMNKMDGYTGMKRAASMPLERIQTEDLTDEQLIMAMDACEESSGGYSTQQIGHGPMGATLHTAVSPQFNE